MTTKPKFVILTVPHAVCRESQLTAKIFGIHTCDYAAEGFAKILKNKLDKSGVKNELLIGNIHRMACPNEACDLNRKAASNTKFRKNLREIVKNNVNNFDIYVLDIHSYPPTEPLTKDLDLYLIIEKSGGLIRDYYLPDFVKDLQKSWGNNGMRLALLKGIKNDIQAEMLNDFGVNSTLIEINERNLHDKNERIADSITEYFGRTKKDDIIVSPVTGVTQNKNLTSQIPRDTKLKFGIYIDVNDPHQLYSPIDGKVTSVKAEKGKFIIPSSLIFGKKIFKANELEEGRLIIDIKNDSGYSVQMIVYVGHPRWPQTQI